MVELPAQIGVEAGFPHVGPPAGIDPVEDVPAPDELHHHVRVELRHLRRAHRRPGRAPVQLLVIGARVPDRAAQRDATAHPAGVVQRDEKAGKGEEDVHAQQGAARPGHPCVVQQHRCHGRAANPVQGGDVVQAAGPSRGGGRGGRPGRGQGRRRPSRAGRTSRRHRRMCRHGSPRAALPAPASAAPPRTLRPPGRRDTILTLRSKQVTDTPRTAGSARLALQRRGDQVRIGLRRTGVPSTRGHTCVARAARYGPASRVPTARPHLSPPNRWGRAFTG